MTRCKLLLRTLAALLVTGVAAAQPASATAGPASAPANVAPTTPRPLPTAREILGPATAPALPAQPATVVAAPAPTPAPAVVAATPGTVAGSIRFKGPEHEGERLDLPQAIRPLCGPFKRTFPYLVVQGSKLAWVVVWLEGVADRQPVASEPLVLTARRCEWQPELATATRGQVLVLANQDAETQQPTLRWLGVNESADPARRPLRMWIPSRGQQLAVVLKTTGVLELATAANRPWQRARVRVFEHGHHTTSGERGDFELPSVPPGSYTLHAWHPTLGETQQVVTVQSGRQSSVTFTYTPAGPEVLAPGAAPSTTGQAAQPASAPAAGSKTHAP